ncbi:hypothetical protein BX600DRAFT_269678 [Xylariales sp. PMI_506]|nr:hypothetical protein BX600DRAFT_269678 [Xylariales sp. PMI_506]
MVINMAHAEADRQKVYLACRTVFTGSKARLQPGKSVRNEIKAQKAILQPLIQDLGITRVRNIAQYLMDKRVFESEANARSEFPGLFDVLPDLIQLQDDHGANPARAVSVAAQHVAISPGAEVERPVMGTDESQAGEGSNGSRRNFNGGSNHNQVRGFPDLCSLRLLHIPYKTQHLILTEAQRLLEECCYEFTRKWIPSLLEREQCDCPAAFELTKWTKILVKVLDTLPRSAFGPAAKPMGDILLATDALRHSAVHRLPTTITGIQELVKSGVDLAIMLGDDARASKLESICEELGGKEETMEQHKIALLGDMWKRLEQIQRQREELEREEKELIEGVLKSDTENKFLVGMLLDNSVDKILRRDHDSDVFLSMDEEGYVDVAADDDADEEVGEAEGGGRVRDI